MLRVVRQVFRLQAHEMCVCSETKTKIFYSAFPPASSVGTSAHAAGWNFMRNYQTGWLPWNESLDGRSDGREWRDQVDETSKILANRKLYSLNWSPHGLSLIPKLALIPPTAPKLHEAPSYDDSSDDGLQVRFEDRGHVALVLTQHTHTLPRPSRQRLGRGSR